MTSICDLPHDLLGEKIFAKVPITSLRALRSTCKLWNDISKDLIVGKATTRQHEFLGFLMMFNKVYFLRFDLQGIRKDDGFVHPSIKQVALPNHVAISTVFLSEGLVFGVTMDNSKLMVWNPYLGQTRWIEPRKNFHSSDSYVLGYDNNRNHKILRILPNSSLGQDLAYEIYDFSSDSWRVLYVTPNFEIRFYQHGVTLKGNTYFVKKAYYQESLVFFLLCFDFTRERFGQLLPLPFYGNENVTLSCVREEQLAALYENPSLNLQFWVTNKIEPNSVSWSKFLVVDMTLVYGYRFLARTGCFFIDETNKVAVFFCREGICGNYKADIIGEDGYFKSVSLEKTLDVKIPRHYPLTVSSSYLPSLVHIKKPHKRNLKGKDKNV